MLRESLMKPEIVLWSFGLPVVVLLVYISLMGFRSIRRADRPRRMVVWLLPPVVLFMTYYMWGFQVPVARAIVYVGGGSLLCVAVAFMQDAFFVSTQRVSSGDSGDIRTLPGAPESRITDPGCEMESDRPQHDAP